MLAPGGTTWEGDAADAAQERAWADLVKVRGLADCLHDASAVARNGVEDITWAKRQTLDGIAEAEENRFSVAEDLSVIPPSASSPLARVPVAEAVAAQEYATQIATRAQTLAAIDQQVAGRITSALAPLQGASFGDTTGERAPIVQATGYKFKQDIQDGDHDPYTGADNHKPQPKTPLPPAFDPNTGVAENGGGPLGKILQHEVEPFEDGVVASQVPRVPLNATRAQIEAKFKHDTVFVVAAPRGTTGFDQFNKAVTGVVDNPSTLHISGTYHGNPAILNYNAGSHLVVVQTPDGAFVSGWRVSDGQAWNIINRGSLGGG